MSDTVKRPYRSIVRDLCKPSSDRVPVYDADVADDMFRTLETRCAELDVERRVARLAEAEATVRCAEQAKTIERLRELLRRTAIRIPKIRKAGMRGQEKNLLRVQIDAELEDTHE